MTSLTTKATKPESGGPEKGAAQAVAVRIRGLTKHFGSGEQTVQALRRIDWDVYAGQMTLLVGPSGCGKTTLLSIIAGILDADTGNSQRLRPGDDDHERSCADAISRPEHRIRVPAVQPLAGLSAAENAAIPLMIGGWSRERAVRRAGEVLAAIGMANKLRQSS